MVCGLILGIRCLLKEGTLLIHPALLCRNLYACLSEGLKHPSWQVLPHGPDFIEDISAAGKGPFQRIIRRSFIQAGVAETAGLC